MRFAQIKSADQQSTVTLHRTGDLLVRQRTMLANALRGHLAEFGLVAASGIWKLSETHCAGGIGAGIAAPDLARGCMDMIVAQIEALERRIAAVERAIHSWHRRG
jgi:transposase